MSRTVIGVFHLVNKQPEEANSSGGGGNFPLSAFSQNDADMLEAVAVFAGIAISNTKLYESAMRAIAKQQVALEVLSYHATAPAEEALRLKVLYSLLYSTLLYSILLYCFPASVLFSIL